MNIAMQWSYTDTAKETKTLEEHIKEAFAYYYRKYNAKPDTCHVNPAIMPDKQTIDKIAESGIQLVEDKSIAKGQLWIGENERESY